MREALLSDFSEQIFEIEQELENLADMSYDIGEAYSDNIFSNQERLSADMENLVIAMTHEAATHIGFMRMKINTLSDYIRFREIYFKFSDIELEEIIDGDISMSLKMDLYTRLGGTQAVNEVINDLKTNWNKSFNNLSYAKVKSNLSL